MQTTPSSAVASPGAERFPGGNEDLILLLGRVALGAIFVKSGMQKLMALGAFAASLAGRGIPQSEMWAIIGALVECVGGILIVTGFRTRPAALLMVLFVIVATAISHRYWEFADAARRAQESQFFKNVSIIGGFLLLFASGPGRFSIDGLLRRRAQGNRSRPM
jgi:putative oxidoreductase